MINKTEQEIMTNWDSTKSPSVSICCITYNHEKFISEAIDSFLMQKTTFSFEILIGEDCSSDNTFNIINEYKSHYPNLIQIITSDSNVGMQRNFIRTFNSCVGTYIALCEGDDYWTDIYKLQKQIDFLEKNSDFMVCCHQSENFAQNTQAVIGSYPNINAEKEMTIIDLFNANIANTCTFVYRNVNIKIPNFFKELKLGDWPLHMLHAEYGKIKYLSENMARYRLHGDSVWSTSLYLQQIDSSINMLHHMNTYFEGKYLSQINASITKYLWVKAFYCLDKNESHEADICYQDAQKYGKIHAIDKVKYLLKKELPAFYKYSSLIYQRIKILLQEVKAV